MQNNNHVQTCKTIIMCRHAKLSFSVDRSATSWPMVECGTIHSDLGNAFAMRKSEPAK